MVILGKGMVSRPAITRGLLERSHGRAAGVHVPTSNDLLTGRVSRHCPVSRNQLLLALSATLVWRMYCNKPRWRNTFIYISYAP